MKEDNLVHADASPALSQNGQQTSVPNRCSDRDIQTGIDYLVGDRDQGTKHHKSLHRVIVFLEGELRKRRHAKENKRQLSASPGRVVDRNAPGCDGRSLETKSFLAKEDADGNG